MAWRGEGNGYFIRRKMPLPFVPADLILSGVGNGYFSQALGHWFESSHSPQGACSSVGRARASKPSVAVCSLTIWVVYITATSPAKRVVGGSSPSLAA